MNGAQIAFPLMPHLPPTAWVLAIIAALCIGLAKAGFGGVGLISVALMASILPPLQSTGVVLPLLIVADCFAVQSFRQHARWKVIRRVLPAALLAVILGALIMRYFNDPAHPHNVLFKRLIGGIILGLTLLQYARSFLQRWLARERARDSLAQAWAMGGLAGITTMLANAAGPVMSLYLLELGLPKLELVGTSAWIFLILNGWKVPFSYSLGLIGQGSLVLDLCLLPAVALGVFCGRWLLHFVPERGFQQLILLFALIISLHLIFS